MSTSAFVSHSRWLNRGLIRLLFVTCSVLAVHAQRAGGGGTGGIGGGGIGGIGGVTIGPGGINLGGNVTIPGNVTVPGNIGAISPGPRIIADNGILVGDTAQASVVVVSSNTTAAGGTQLGVSTAPATYQWTITGGKITGDATRQTVAYVADAAGTVTLNVVVTTNGTPASTSADVTVISPDLAGTITAPPTVATGAANISASVPPAQNNDRTFRWTVTGGMIASGQGTNTVTVKPGTPGLLEVSCDVALQRIVTVTLHSLVVVTGSGAPTPLTVTGGDGTGTYPAGSKIDIFANPPAAGQVFDKWTGDITALGTSTLAPSFAHAVVTMPATPVSLTATYKPAPTITVSTVQNFNPVTVTGTNNTTTTVSTTLIDYVPPAAQAIVVVLHDTGGRAGDWFTLPEAQMLVRDLTGAGYGVVALNSVNRNPGAWSAQTTLATNQDALNIAAALDKVTKDNALPATTPLFLLGLANGADAAARFGDMLATTAPTRPVKGVVLFCATGGNTLAVTSHVPQFIALAANDENLGVTGNTDARDNQQLLAGRGVATAIMSNGPSPLKGRIRALGTDADGIFVALQKAGMLDANNYVKVMPSADALKTALGTTYQARAADVAQEMAAAYAAQEVYSDADARVINFLNNRVADAPVPAPGRIVNLSTRTSLSYLGDSFTLGFGISGTQKAQLLIRGIGPALKKFGLDNALPAPRLEVNDGSGKLIASNEGWSSAPNAAQITSAAASVGAFALAPTDADTAVLLTLDPGTYTATIKGLNGTTGDVLAEVYDISRNGTRLTNLSTLGKIANTGDLLVPGITVAGTNPRTLLIRAVGPGLTDFGMGADAVLGDPRITVLTTDAKGASQTVATNNNWALGGTAGQAATLNAAFPAVGAFPLKAASSDAALVNALAPASYTLQAGSAPLPANPGANFVAPNQTGTVLVEVYEVP